MNLTDRLTEAVANPVTDDDLDLNAVTAEVLDAVGMRVEDAGGSLAFEGGADPFVPARFRFGSAAAVALGAKAVAASSLWRERGGDPQNIRIDVRRAFRRFAGFADGSWELVNGRAPSSKWNRGNPFLDVPFFRRTKDGRSVVALNMYPGLRQRALGLLNCPDSSAAVDAAIGRWNADELEQAGADAGIVLAKVRTLQEFLAEPQYTDVLAELPLIEIIKVADGDPIPLSPSANAPLSGVRALGMAHVIAGAAIGRDLASFGADVLNVWRPDDVELDAFYWDTQVGMRSTYLSASGPDRTRFDELLAEADVFFSNRHPGYLARTGLTVEELAATHRGLVQAEVNLHGPTGPWSDRPGFDEIGACVAGIFALEGTLEDPKQPPLLPIVDNVVGWLGTTGVLAALRRRATEGGSYHVRVSLTKTCLWLMSLGIFDREFAAFAAGSTLRHTLVAPELFTATTPLGSYQGMTEQIDFSSLKLGYTNILSPMGADEPVWSTPAS